MKDSPMINLSLSLDEMTEFADKVRDMFGDEVDGDGEYKPAKQGVKAGLREGETRITCVFGEDENKVLHDWAKTTGHTFREVCISMVDHYINNVVAVALMKSNRKLNAIDGDVPQGYAHLYGDNDDAFAAFFGQV